VISVGNLAAGGRGKTPVVVTLARLLVEAGERPAILSRGYGRRQRRDGVVVVSDGSAVVASVDESGDEPLMLAHLLPGVPVIVAADRYLAGSLAEGRLDCTVHVLDDGFQHLQLARDVDLLLVHPRDVDDRVLPSGRLREPREAAASADALLVAGARDQAEELSAALGVRTAFCVEPRFGAARWLDAGPSNRMGPTTSDVGPILPDGPTGGRVVAVAGIAEPSRFFDALRALGWDVARAMPFADHHWFTAADHARIADAVREAGAAGVITTEKDAARLAAVPAQASDAIWAVLPMEMAIEPADAFAAWLLSRIRRRAGPSGPAAHEPVRRSAEREGG
jgi:tetraacyldisaccharide 4'-kinase